MTTDALPGRSFGMAPSAQQECFGDAFLLAVAAVAGCAVLRPRTDNDSVDWTLSCRLSRRPKLDVQMKTWIHDGGTGDDIRYPLKKKNYDDLVLGDLLTPRILVLVLLPDNPSEWLSSIPEQVVLRRCGYWTSLTGQPRSGNVSSVTVTVPRTNLLTVEALRGVMHRINEGGAP